jgi:hypothetical protein
MTAQIANAAGVAAIGAVYFALELNQSSRPAACRIGAVCAVDDRLRRVSDMDASRHGMTN